MRIGSINPRTVAALTALIWGLLAGLATLTAVFAAAVASPAFLVLGPWAGACILLVALLIRKPTRRSSFILSLCGALASLASSVVALATSTEGFRDFAVTLIAFSGIAAVYSIIGARQASRITQTGPVD